MFYSDSEEDYDMCSDSEGLDPQPILDLLDNQVCPGVWEKRKCVAKFVAMLKKELTSEDDQSILWKSYLEHTGSVYEGLEVKHTTDFDILLVLGPPFIGENFEIKQQGGSYYSLQLIDEPDPDLSDLFSNANNLMPNRLRQRVFDRLRTLLNGARVTHDICCVKLIDTRAAMIVVLDTPLGYVNVDVIPQIAVKYWYSCPGLVPTSELPGCLQDSVSQNEQPFIYMTPSALTDACSYNVPSDICFTISFTLMEKKIMRSDDSLCNLTRLLKACSVARKWSSRFGFRPYLVKRYVIKHLLDEDGGFYAEDMWETFQEVTSAIGEELYNEEYIQGYFVQDAVIYEPEDYDTIESFCEDLQIVSEWGPWDLQDAVSLSLYN